jgi:hypothetical protein
VVPVLFEVVMHWAEILQLADLLRWKMDMVCNGLVVP